MTTVHAGKLRIAFLGDSITVGDGDAQARGWPSRLMEATSPLPTKMQCCNLGVGGDRIEDVANRCEAELAARLTGRDGTAVVIMIGVNDALRASAAIQPLPIEPTALARDLAHIIKTAQCYGNVVVIEPTPVVPELTREDGGTGKAILENLELVNKCLYKAAQTHAVPLLPMTAQLLTDQKFTQALRNNDGLHPTAAGYERISHIIQNTPFWGMFLRGAGANRTN